MKILALDTATESCSAALLLDGRTLASEQLLEHGHAQCLLPMIDALLVDAGVALGALDAIAFGRGPGAFTGVRLAASVTQGLAFAAGLGVVPVSNLRALAQRALTGAPGEGGESAALVLACTDARMREVYWGCYERAGELAVPVGEERVGDPGAVTLPAAWGSNDRPGPGPAPAAGGGMQGVGSGFSAYPQLRAALGSRLGRILAELR
ncbi:MAG: tRNA (adenosine(37)-N6)-threonylcarbamoyltransferase complex dimerization subunit type 1 TsaB, partial [Gammaproteobacteria bacterium]|nr:tRNA (adenosine(37)-N6)-threonylcarbamoyltransferase complex dimerization subunit type 1 TsaB [Gammaproteobacteria bacterium]